MIIAAAIKLKSGAVLTGVRHCEIFADMRRLDIDHKNVEQGFIDEAGEYYSRDAAQMHVIICRQNYNPISTTLTSEDLW